MHPATGRGRGKAVKVYSAKGRRRHRTKVKPRRGVAEGKTPHTYLTLHNIQIGKTPVGWAGSKQETGGPERDSPSLGVVSFGGTSE